MYGYFVTSFRTVICNDVRINYDNELFENVNVRMYDIYSIPGTYIYSYHILKKKIFSDVTRYTVRTVSYYSVR
jgi:hypothetical protein